MINKLVHRLPYISKDKLEAFFEERTSERWSNSGHTSKETAEYAAFFDTIDFFAYENHIKETTLSAM